MNALVVFESMFGNTRDVAEAVADGLRGGGTVQLVEVGAAPTTIDADVDLVVAGGPTHAFGLSRETTREDASRKAADEIVSRGIGLREWLEAVRLHDGVHAATFDTRIDKPRVPGSAAKAAAKRLRRHGADRSVDVESFYVHDMTGPLLDGELERARAWGAALAQHASAAEHVQAH